MLTTMGLAAKNAILIVEFAKELYEHQGRTLIQAAAEAARLRLRPIIMTSIVFVMGVLPLARAVGPSSGSQHALLRRCSRVLPAVFHITICLINALLLLVFRSCHRACT
jgi:multidrug efflux pump subunit AcrB